MEVLGCALLMSKSGYFVGYVLCIRNNVVSILGQFGPLNKNCTYRK